jgi:hypothetical protein
MSFFHPDDFIFCGFVVVVVVVVEGFASCVIFFIVFIHDNDAVDGGGSIGRRDIVGIAVVVWCCWVCRGMLQFSCCCYCCRWSSISSSNGGVVLYGCQNGIDFGIDFLLNGVINSSQDVCF